MHGGRSSNIIALAAVMIFPTQSRTAHALAVPSPAPLPRERMCDQRGEGPNPVRIGPAGALEHLVRDPGTGCWQWVAVGWGGPR